jgi:hypothetical protein
MAIEKPSAADVQTIIAATDAQANAAIEDAALIAETCVTSLAGDRQKAIIKYLAAHLIASGIGAQKTSERLGDASVSWARAQMGQGLLGTSYGQQAIALDPNGCLLKIGKVKAFMETL